jgi:hypothetical protein
MRLIDGTNVPLFANIYACSYDFREIAKRKDKLLSLTGVQ